MHLYLLRHGIAEDQGARALDEERKLVEEGKDKTRAVTKAIAQMNYPMPEIVITSPFIRAVETAEIAIIEFAKDAKLKQNTALVPMADITTTMALVEEVFKKHKVVMFVGHEPHMSSFGSSLLGLDRPILEMKKSAVALFEVQSAKTPRVRAILVGLFPPRVGNLW